VIRSSPSPLRHEYTDSSGFPTDLETAAPARGIRSSKKDLRGQIDVREPA